MSGAKPNYEDWTQEELIAEINKLSQKKEYGLVWDEERELEDVVLKCKKELPVLKEVKSKAIPSRNPDSEKPTHILIEGDNYHALSVLNYTHEKSVDVIYIDPPYNTGAKDWKYNNNFVDENDAYRHSKWLSFMNNRLKIAKYLLKPTGVLVCAIDKNEQERLGLLLDNIFPSYKKTCVTIIHNPGGTQSDNFSYSHEYAYFIYPSIGRFINLQQRDEDPDIRPLRDVSTGEHLRKDAQNCFYPIYVKEGKIIGFGDVCDDSFHPNSANVERHDGILEIYPIDSKGNERKWVFARQNVESIKDELFIEFNERRKIWDVIRNKTMFNYKTVWTDKKYNSNAYGSNLLNRIIDESFPYPKSLYNTKECLDAVVKNNKDAVILDFFAGSGTTAHAVLEMNRLDDGKRQFIICTNNESDICEKVCYPRVDKVINGYKAKSKIPSLLFDRKITFRDLSKTEEILKELDEIKNEHTDTFEKFEVKFEDNVLRLFGVTNKESNVEGFGGNLKYFCTSFVSSLPTDKNKEILTQKSVEMLCLRENTFELVSENDTIKIFKNNTKHTAILFNETKIDELKEMVSSLDSKVFVYIFSLEDDDFSEEFEEMNNKVKVCSIPAAILNVYRRIFK